MVKLYGISNCDSCRKARAWLTARHVVFEFQDYKQNPPSEALLREWSKHVPWDSLLNRRGMTWRQLSDSDRASVVDQNSAFSLMLSHSSLIKRPVLTVTDHVLVGFNSTVWSGLFPEPKPI